MNYKDLKKYLTPLYLFLASVLLVPMLYFLRYKKTDEFFAGHEIFHSFLNSRSIASESLASGQTILSMFGSSSNLFDTLLSLINPDYHAIFVLVINSIVLIAVLQLLVQVLYYHKIKYSIANLAGFLILLSPTFIYLLWYPTKHTFGIFLLLLALFLSKRESHFAKYFSLVVFMMAPLVHWIHGLVAVFAILLDEGKSAFAYVTLFFTSLVSLLSLIYGSSLSLYLNLDLQVFFADFGSVYGIGIFTIVLSVVGFAYAWQKKYPLQLGVLALAVLGVLSFNISTAVTYVSLALNLFAANALFKLVKRGWKLTEIRNVSLLLIACGILFSLVAYVDEHANSEPSSELKETLLWLEGYSSSSGSVDRVLTHPKYNLWVSYYSGLDVVGGSVGGSVGEAFGGSDLDSRFVSLSPSKSKVSSSDFKLLNSTYPIFYYRGIVRANNYFRENSVGYLLVTPAMKSGLLWDESDDGLLFLLSNPETFKLVYEKSGYLIYEISV